MHTRQRRTLRTGKSSHPFLTWSLNEVRTRYAHWDGKKERSVPNSAMTAHFPFPLTVMETVQVSTECIVAEISTSITI